MTATTPEEEAPQPQMNRAMRRGKGRRLTMADMRKWQAEGIKNKLFTPKDGKETK